VHFVIRDFRGIGRPPIRGARVEFFGIDPVELAFQNFFAAAGGERGNRAAGYIHGEKMIQRLSGENLGSSISSSLLRMGFGFVVFRSSSTRLLLPMKSRELPSGAQT